MPESNPAETPPTGSEQEQTPEKNPPADVEEEKIKNHPLYKDLQEKHSAEAREKDRYKGRLDKLQKEISGEEEPEPKNDSDKPVTRAELDDVVWQNAHVKELELYSDDEYKDDCKTGIPKDKALKYAKLRYETLDTSAKRERQLAMSSGSSTDRSAKAEGEITLTAEQKRRGITVEMIKKHRAKVEEKE